MIRRELRSVLLLGPALAVAAGAAAPATAQETIRVADYDVTALEFPPLPEFRVPEPERMELENGMTVFLLEDRELPQVRALARIRIGSVWEPAEKVGLASVTGTVMRTGGTASIPPDSLNEVLEGLGATVETSVGQVSGTAFMSALTETVDVVLPIFAEVLREPVFAEEKVALAKSQRRSSISRRNDSPQGIAFREFGKILYGEDSPYARHPEYWTIDAIAREDLVAFHRRYVHPENVILSVWGDFDAERMKKRIRRHFGDWPRVEDAARPVPPPPEAERRHTVHFIQKDDVNQSTILIGHPGELVRDDPDYPPVVIMNEVLSGGFSGRLFRNVRKEKGLAYAVFGNYSANYDRPGRFFAGVFSKSESTVEAADAVSHEVERMREAPPTEEELGVAKDAYLNSFVFNFDTKREVLSRLMTYEAYGYPSDFLQRTREAVEEVSAEDVHRVSRAYLHPEESHVLVLGRRQDFSRDLPELARGVGVGTVDISIPTRPPAEREAAPPATDQERAGGMDALLAAREALGGEALRGLRTLRVEGETVQETPQGSVTIATTTTAALPDRFRVEQRLPTGVTIAIVDDGERMAAETPAGTRPVPDRMRRQVVAQLWRSPLYLLANLDREGLDARDLGTKEVDGTPLRAVEVSPPEGEPFTLYLDPATDRPARLDYTAMTQQGPSEATDVYGDYRTVSGVRVPFTTITYRDGEESARTTVTGVEIDPELEEGLFSTEGASGSGS